MILLPRNEKEVTVDLGLEKRRDSWKPGPRAIGSFQASFNIGFLFLLGHWLVLAYKRKTDTDFSFLSFGGEQRFRGTFTTITTSSTANEDTYQLF